MSNSRSHCAPCASRRDFVRACAALAALAAGRNGRLAEAAQAADGLPKVKLVGADGKPLAAGNLAVDENYVFLYPFASTPCLLLRLGAAPPNNIEGSGDKMTYKWPGGVGQDKAVVAYSAICAHAFTRDSKRTSFLTYSKDKNKISGNATAITCCAHGSVYDPAAAAKVLAGPAPYALASITLDWDSTSDELSAAGLLGTPQFDQLFSTQKDDLIAEFGRGGFREQIAGQTVVVPIASFSQDIIRC